MSLADDFKTALEAALRQSDRTLQRFPCGCFLQSHLDDCPHAKGKDVLMAGRIIEAANVRACQKTLLNKKASENDKALAKLFLGVPMNRRPKTTDLFRDAQRKTTSGKRATAPCGHPGEHVVGQYIRCLYGCDGEAVKAPEIRLKKCRVDCKARYKRAMISLMSWTDPRTGRTVISCAECGDILERL